jgi:hypothetical protein
MTAMCSTEAVSASWQRAHAELVRLAKERAGLDREEGRWLLTALRTGAHHKLGFARFEEYIEALFGYGPRFVRERLRVAEALEELSKTSQALCDGQACWSVVRELTRVATPETEEAWLLATQGKTARQVEQMVSGRVRGDLPDTPARAEARRHVLRLELSAETMATYREAVAKLQREAGSGLSEDEALLMMARHVLDGPKDQGRAGYQIAMSVCPECEQGRQQGRGELLPVGPEVVEMAACDAQRVQPTHVGATHVGATHVGATHVSASSMGRARATQDIPPATRRHVMHRAQGRCQVPSCRCSTFLDLHHLRPRCEGGDHDPDQIIVLCGAHHRAVHRGTLWIEGTVSEGLRFRHADGTAYGSVICMRTPMRH